MLKKKISRPNTKDIQTRKVLPESKKKLMSIIAVFLLLVIGASLLFALLASRREGASSATVALSNGQKASRACDLIGIGDVEKTIGEKAERIAGQFDDKTQPNLLSNCLYRSTGKPSRAVTITIRGFGDEDSAKSAMVANSKRPETEEVNGLGDEAQYTKGAQQLMVREDSRIITITAGRPTDNSKKDSRDVAIDLYKAKD